MTERLALRSNEAWIEALRGHGHDCARAVEELATYLGRAIARGTRGQLEGEDLTEIVHESIGRIVKGLPAFRGDSAFTTWATGVALRVAFTELRRRYARARLKGAFEAITEELRGATTSIAPTPDEALSRTHLYQVLEIAIATRLTERQRVAIMAELRGIPTVEIAERLGTNTNALYKLTHDARRRLHQTLVEAGFTAESIHMHAAEAP